MVGSLKIKLVWHLLFLTTATQVHSKVTNHACDRTETRFYSHDSVQDIVRFIASKDCHLSKEARNSQFFTSLEDHGCWCNSITGGTAHGLPVDEVDRTCRKWHTCQKCTQRESCPEDETATIFQISYNAKSKSFSCMGDSGSSCSYDKCVCTLKLAVEIYSEIKINTSGRKSIVKQCDKNAPRPMLRFGQNLEEYDRCCKDESSQSWVQYDSEKEFCDVDHRVKSLQIAANSDPEKLDEIANNDQTQQVEKQQQNLLESLFQARRAYLGGDSDLDEINETERPKYDTIDLSDFESTGTENDEDEDEEHSAASMFRRPPQLRRQSARSNLPSNVLMSARSGEQGQKGALMQVTKPDPVCEDCRLEDRWENDVNNLCYKPHGEDQRRYYTCHHGEKVEMQCVPGLLFDRELKMCNFQSIVLEKLRAAAYPN